MGFDAGSSGSELELSRVGDTVSVKLLPHAAVNAKITPINAIDMSIRLFLSRFINMTIDLYRNAQPYRLRISKNSYG